MNTAQEEPKVPKHQIVADGKIIYESEVEDFTEVWRVWWNSGRSCKHQVYYYYGIRNMESKKVLPPEL